jgi:hypothetical protein
MKKHKFDRRAFVGASAAALMLGPYEADGARRLSTVPLEMIAL